MLFRPYCNSIIVSLPVTISITHSIVQKSGSAILRPKFGQREESVREVPDADASNNSGFPGRFVQNVLQHRSVLAPTRRCDHLSRLAQGEGRLVVLPGEVRLSDPIYMVTEGSRFGFA